jgi:HAD superfamily phosphatase (TIGR01668 family)
MLITPEYVFKDVTHITPEWLAAKGITALVLDIDNTLTADRSQELPEEVAAWLAAMRKAGVKLTIVSNGAEKRCAPLLKSWGLPTCTAQPNPCPLR